MRKGVFGLAVVLCSGMLFVGGCAKEELVKKDEPVAPSQAPVAQPATQQAQVPTEPVQSQPVKDSTAVNGVVADSQTTVARAPEVKLQTVYFDFDSSVLTQASRDTLYGNAEYLLKKYNGTIQVEGHCDERGSDEYNLALGEKRAKAALNYLTTLGVPTNRLSFISYGKEKPADPGHDEAAWAKNRRAEFVITK
ncbi:peptidoglycan-associated lipoprotein Pal [Geobacter argillaceus]|uniref:Peptidoglycan-associated lipoprotein n=1 Tax=Geobacter argillaceus TaxID=345631 RepID=A0A562VNX0_9BACT|nr:peptidoglycan-associated lipoprotein Pal [Geobacter argillaceus]TWJ19502.1 peptidoglycan-associated lipoprotein [Geobacter argillaceus]